MSSTSSGGSPRAAASATRRPQVSIASTYLPGFGNCEPAWNDSPTTRRPRPCACSISPTAASASQPNLRDRSMIVSGFRNEMRSSRRTRLRETTNFAISSALSTTKVLTPKSSACRMSDPRLIGCVCTQRPGRDAGVADQVHFAIRRQVKPGPLAREHLDDRAVRQRLQRVVEIDARQGPGRARGTGGAARRSR